ncbi:hypothetical protein Tco_0998898, partial [Tanacetum coccineum]
MDNNILSNKEWMESDYRNPLNTTTDSFFKAHDERNIKEGNELRQMKHKGDNKNDEQPIKRVCKAEKFEAIQYSLGPNEEYIAVRRFEYNTWERNEEKRYGISVPALTKDHEGSKIQYAVSRRRQYAVFKLYGKKIFWKISNVVPTPRNPQYAVSKTLDTPETAKYGKIWYDEDFYDLRSVETEFPAIVFNDSLTSNETLSCEPTVSTLNDNEIDFRISFEESDGEDYTIVFDKNSFSFKIISTNDLKTDLENDNEKVNVPLFPSPEPTVSCIDDLDFFKDFENEFPAIVYNDALTSKSDFSTEPTLCPQHIDEFDLKDETSLSEYDEVEQNVLYFNDLFPFNIIYPDDLISDKGNDDNEIDMLQSLGGNENTQGSNKLLEGSHDKISKVFIMRSFVIELNVNIVAWNHLVNGMLFNLIKNLFVPFGITFDPKWYYKDSDCARMLLWP